METIALHQKFMARCFQLAGLGKAEAAPNPMVGAVLVYDDKIIGEGYHTKYGSPHAEVECINNVTPADQHVIAESTLYVSLEPCNHYGKTPPCTDLIIEKGVKKVVIGCGDSYEKVNGSGVRKLREAGIEVIENVCEKEALEINKRFFTFHQQQRPYIILKWAQSADGFIGKEGEQIKISNSLTDRLVHTWRSEEAAILVGTQTVLTDDPSLTTRWVEGKNPVRLIIDKNLSVPFNYKIFDNSSPTIIVNTKKQEDADVTSFYKIGEEENVPAVIINLMHQRLLTSLMVEGGTKTLQSFIDAGLWDEARIITNESLQLKEGIAAPVLHSSSLISAFNLKTDRIEFRKHDNA